LLERPWCRGECRNSVYIHVRELNRKAKSRGRGDLGKRKIMDTKQLNEKTQNIKRLVRREALFVVEA